MSDNPSPALGRSSPTERSVEQSSAPFTREEKRRMFRGMVVAELEAGLLRYSRRQALLSYAAKLGIHEFDACLLIAEAQYHAGDIEPVSLDTPGTLSTDDDSDTWSIPFRLAVTLAIAIGLDLLIIYWLVAG